MKLRISCLLLLTLLGLSPLFAQNKVGKEYFLPQDVEYDENIPTPSEVLGYEVGEWHVSHDQLQYYMRTLAAASDRIQLEEIGRTYENRPLLNLIFTTPENHKNLESIRLKHLENTNPDVSKKLKNEEVPMVLYMGYSIHGNESSGANASLLVAYHLAAAKGEQIEKMLANTVILFDPCYNPDGLHRFSSWVNSHKGINVVNADPQSREHNEAWPRGRTNHYWFDLNRDWLLLQHPESRARIAQFHKWKPNWLTDHHEMGSNASFFFMPGVPSRNNPRTPEKVFELTGKVAEYHGKALDKIGSLYYTKEGFDDFYIGKGSTYPDVNGAVGILFEQASSRGHSQETIHGRLDFPFTIRNQFTTSLSTLQGTFDLRDELVGFQRDFFSSALKEANNDPVKALVFSAEEDRSRTYNFAKILEQHDIDIYHLGDDFTSNGNTYSKENGYIVPLNQRQYRLIKAIFEKRTSFTDSLFYDVSAWTMPLAFNVVYDELDQRQMKTSLLGEAFSPNDVPKGELIGGKSDYAYVFQWHEYYSPRALNRLHNVDLRVKASTKRFSDRAGQEYDYGSILIPVEGQELSSGEIYRLMQSIAKEDRLKVHAMETGMTEGLSLGSNSFRPLRKPRVALLVDGGVSSYEAGEVWHLLDQRYYMDVSLIQADRFSQIDMDEYNTLVMVNGNYGRLDANKLKEWIRNGGVVLAYKSAINWLGNQQMGNLEFVYPPRDTTELELEYVDRQNKRGAQVIGGAIFQVKMDLSHPLAYGYKRPYMSVFRNSSLFLKKSNTPYKHPIVYTDNPLQSGYISDRNLETLSGSAAASVSRMGGGRIIALTDNPNFRAYWHGGSKLFMNGIFFGNLIN